jgi:hypothetical protein
MYLARGYYQYCRCSSMSCACKVRYLVCDWSAASYRLTGKFGLRCLFGRSPTSSFVRYTTDYLDWGRSWFSSVHRKNNIKYFMFCWPCISIYLCNENQLDALFILSLFRQSTSKCFGHICSPSSGGILYIYKNWYVLCSSVDCLLARLTRHARNM